MPATPGDPSTRMAQERTALAESRTRLADHRSGLAVTRTVLALDRTLMAWVRTATSLMSFGFTVYKFFEYLAQDGPRRPQVIGPRGFALVLMAVGMGALFVATMEHRRQRKLLRETCSMYGSVPGSPAEGVAGAVSVLGIVGIALVYFRL